MFGSIHFIQGGKSNQLKYNPKSISLFGFSSHGSFDWRIDFSKEKNTGALDVFTTFAGNEKCK